MEIHELNTKSMTSPAYCALDDGSDTYKLDLNAVLDTMNTAVDTKVQKKTRIWYASVSSQTGTPNITISGYDPGDNDYLMLLFQFGNTSIKDVHIGAATYDIWYKGANTVVKADGGERVLYRIRTQNVVPYRLEYVGNHYDLATTSAKGLMSAADKAALDQAVSDVSDIQEELLNKADKVGSAPDLIAGLAEGLNTDEGTTIEEPYNLKVSGGNGRELLKKIVGVSVGWNQLVNTGATSVTVTSGHKYYAKVNGVETVAQSSGAAIPINDSSADMVVDLTLALGSTIADYVYSLETATAGAGVAWLKQHFSKMFGSYQPYDAGSIQSVTGLSAHKMTGFNQWDEEWEVGNINANGVNSSASDRIRSTGYIHVIPGETYYVYNGTDRMWFWGYDKNKNFVSRVPDTTSYTNITITIPSGIEYLRFVCRSQYGTTYNHDICINLHSERDGEYEPYKEWSYPIDSTKTFRGILKLDANNSPYADGDIYLPSGEVDRRYGEKTFDGSEDWAASSAAQNVFYLTLNTTTFPQLNDSSLQMVSNKYQYVGTGTNETFLNNYSAGVGAWANTANPTATQRYLYVKDSSISSVADFKASLAANPLTVVFTLQNEGTETADPYTESQIVDGYGTEEFVSTSIVPVGNETFYLADLKGKLEDLPTIPEAPTTNGTYVLKATVSGGVAAYSWVSE